MAKNQPPQQKPKTPIPSQPMAGATDRQQKRLDYLLKHRPGSQDIAKIKKKIAGNTPGSTVPTAPFGGEPNPGVKFGGFKNTQGAYDNDVMAADEEARKNVVINNPNQYNPFGNQLTTIDPVTGQPTVTQNLSGNQQGILNRGEDITRAGQNAALAQFSGGQFNQAFNPQLAGRTSTGDMLGDRQRIEDMLFSKFTRDVDTQEARTREQTAQRLANQGIPFSSDPNSRYQQELMADNKRYDTLRENARQTATQLGGEEWQRGFGINEQLIANQFSQQKGIRDQQLGEIATLQNMGTGLMTPNFQQYQGTNYNVTDPTSIYAALEQLKLAKKAQAGSGGGGGGSSTPAPAPSPFNQGPAPGL